MRLDGWSAVLFARRLRWLLEDVIDGDLGAADPMTVNYTSVLSCWLGLLLLKLQLLLLLLA